MYQVNQRLSTRFDTWRISETLSLIFLRRLRLRDIRTPFLRIERIDVSYRLRTHRPKEDKNSVVESEVDNIFACRRIDGFPYAISTHCLFGVSLSLNAF